MLRQIEAADDWQIAFYRSLAFVAAIGLLLGLRYRSGAVAQIRRIGRPGLAGGAMLALASMTFLQAITTTTVANTLFTLAAIPFLTAALAGLLLGERLAPATLATMAAAAAGVAVMLADGLGAGSLYGNGMALLTAIAFSGFAIVILAVIVRALRELRGAPGRLRRGRPSPL